MSNPASPDTQQEGQYISLSGTGFPTGDLKLYTLNALFTPPAGSNLPTVEWGFGPITPSGSIRTAQVWIPHYLYLTQPAVYTVKLRGEAVDGTIFESGNSARVTVTPATIRPNFVSPASMNAGQTVNVLVRVPGASFQQGVTQASFGPETSVGNGPLGGLGPVTVVNSEQIQATVRATRSANGYRTFEIRTGTQVINWSFEIIGPQVTSVDPTSGTAGSTQTVRITANRTSWVQGVTRVRFGPGVRVGGGPAGDFGTVRVLDAGTLEADIEILPTASSATVHPLIETTDEVVSTSSAYYFYGYVIRSPYLQSIYPTEAYQGETVNVTAYGNQTQFLQGTTVGNFGPAVSVGNAPVGADGPVTVEWILRTVSSVRIPQNATPGLYPVVMKTGTEVASTLTGEGFRVLGPTIIYVDPYEGEIGQSLTLSVTARGTNFTPGTVTASLGAGIRVGGAAAGAFGPVTVVDATTLSIPIQIEAGAIGGVRDLIVQTGSTLLTRSSAFRIRSTLQSVNPAAGNAGQTMTINLTGLNTNWQPGDLQLAMGQGIDVGGLNGDPAGAVTVVSPTQATATISIQPWALNGTRSLSLYSSNDDWYLWDAFTVTNTLPHISSLSETYGWPGATITLEIEGINTNWVQGQTQVSFGQGIRVNGGPPGDFGTVTVLSPTRLSVTLNILTTAADGECTVVVRTGAQSLQLPAAFFVSGGTE